MQFGILGSLEVRDGSVPVGLGGGKQRALLTLLLLDANTPVTVDRLIDDLWGGSPPATAAHTIQVYVSNLRKALDEDRIVRSGPGYLVRVDPDELDLERFEKLVAAGRSSLAAGAGERAGVQLREALALWRGTPLADFVYEPFAQAAIARLEELRLAAVEERIEADFSCGRHAELVGELQAVIAEHPLRERPRGQLMLALYRSGRQAEALEAFQHARRLLVEELGIEPGPDLQELERAILRQDPALLARTPSGARHDRAPERSILVAADRIDQLEQLAELAEPLTLSPPVHELILALPLPPGAELEPATAALNEQRRTLAGRGVVARAAAFTSAEPGRDLVRLASEQDVDLLLLDGPAAVGAGGRVTPAAEAVLAEAPCDVGLVFGREGGDGLVVVPFGGAEDDWAALELAAWCARALGVELTLLGAAADDEPGTRDASRLLAHAALAAQQLSGVATRSTLGPPGAAAVVEATDGARLLVAGIGVDWRHGLGATRAELTERARCPLLLVRRGLRPGGLAPRETLTRFKWSLSGGGARE